MRGYSRGYGRKGFPGKVPNLVAERGKIKSPLRCWTPSGLIPLTLPAKEILRGNRF